jgi:hypothetical protein
MLERKDIYPVGQKTADTGQFLNPRERSATSGSIFESSPYVAQRTIGAFRVGLSLQISQGNLQRGASQAGFVYWEFTEPPATKKNVARLDT